MTTPTPTMVSITIPETLKTFLDNIGQRLAPIDPHSGKAVVDRRRAYAAVRPLVADDAEADALIDALQEGIEDANVIHGHGGPGGGVGVPI